MSNSWMVEEADSPAMVELKNSYTHAIEGLNALWASFWVIDTQQAACMEQAVTARYEADFASNYI